MNGTDGFISFLDIKKLHLIQYQTIDWKIKWEKQNASNCFPDVRHAIPYPVS
jgi:hypothetical protein